MAIQGLSSPLLMRWLRSYLLPWVSRGNRDEGEGRGVFTLTYIHTCVECVECVMCVPVNSQSTGAGTQASAVLNSNRASWTTCFGNELKSSRSSFNDPG